MNERAKRLAGGCQCGAVRYELKTAPEHASICHCRMCQRACGQPFMSFARVKFEDLVWTRGTPGIFRSSNLVERGFCPQCGTPLTYRFIEEGNISVTIGSLDEPENARPELQYGVESELSFTAALPDLPRQKTEESDPDFVARLVNHQYLASDDKKARGT